MQTVLLVIHLILALTLIGIVLMQRSEGGALGIGGGTPFMGARAAANVLTRATAVVAALFMLTSIGLTIVARHSGATRSILDVTPAQIAPGAGKPGGPAAPVHGSATHSGSANPAAPAAPTVLPAKPAPSAPLSP